MGEGPPGTTGGAAPPFAVGSRIAGYQLEEQIGRGVAPGHGQHVRG